MVMENGGSKLRYSQGETTQQRVAIIAVVAMRVSFYFLLYIGVPALFLAVPYVLFHSDKSAMEFFVYGGNFYSTLGMLALLYGLQHVAKRRGLTLVSGIPESLSALEWEKSGLFFVFGVASSMTLAAGLTLIEKIPLIGLLVSQYAEASQTMYSGYDLLFSLVTTVILAPVVEEVLFRGYVLDTLLVTFETKPSIWACTIAFALCHGNLLWIGYALCMGYILTYVALEEDGIYYCIICHFGFNLPSAFVYCINTFSVTGANVLSNVFFLLLVGGISGYGAWRLMQHYLSQNQGYYESIWRKNP